MDKLEQNGISGNLPKILQDFLDNRKQRVELNGQVTSWVNVQQKLPKVQV